MVVFPWAIGERWFFLPVLKKHNIRYLDIDPWAIVETGFHPDRSRVSESLFSLANEFMGIRAHFDEGYGGDALVGSYFNGVFDEFPHVYPIKLKGFADRNHFMANAVNWVYTRIAVDGETLDLARSKIEAFERRLDFRTGTMTRRFVWKLKRGRKLEVKFTRFLSMARARLGAQRIELTPLNFSGSVAVTLGLDLSPVHESEKRSLWRCVKTGKSGAVRAISGETLGSGQKAHSAFRYEASAEPVKVTEIDRPEEKLAGVKLQFRLVQGVTLRVDRLVAHKIDKRRGAPAGPVWQAGMKEAAALLKTTFDREHRRHAAYWEKVWKRFDISIEGDPANEQGTRYCIYQMLSTYHGVDPSLNIGAKGLTGEVYGGLAFWDTETYCLPFYAFTDPDAARNLLRFRYNTLPQAKERARELDCDGARYPMTTIDGTEACGVWWHGDLEIHVPAAVAYGIWHYVHITGDRAFLYQYGLEMLIEISRFYATHGGWSAKTGEFGLWGVMGADEFHMMIHNNAYTNAMAKKTFEWALGALGDMKRDEPKAFASLAKKVGLQKDEPANWTKMARRMRLQRDAKTGLIEQHDGFFDLPHMDLKAIPPEKIPIVRKYPYITRSRYDWIKQPDVLLLPFFFSRDYSLKEKKVNFEYYEPRCVHESSLSPGVHSILATEIGKHDLAFESVKYASRLDLDDYNGNTSQGLHMTSMAAAWLSLTYGFGGMRSDGPRLSFRPTLPAKWKAYSFRVIFRGSLIEVKVNRKEATFQLREGRPLRVDVYGKTHTVGGKGLSIALRTAAQT